MLNLVTKHLTNHKFMLAIICSSYDDERGYFLDLKKLDLATFE